MAKTLKKWSAVGAALVATTTAAQAGIMNLPQQAISSSYTLIQVEDDEGGEGGGESGSELPSSYEIGSSDPKAFDFDAKPQVQAYAELVAHVYTSAREEAEKLDSAISDLLVKPSEASLSAARKAWVAARRPYLNSEAFRFYDGPIEAIEGEINSWPVNEAYIDYVEGNPTSGIINDTSTIDAKTLTALNQKTDEADVTTGWHAIEFLLWGQDLDSNGPGARPFTDYEAGKPANNRRREYLKAVSSKLVDDMAQLEQAWRAGDTSNYRAKFEALEQREALGRIINGVAILAGFEFMSERLAVALDSGDQEDEHSCFSDTTKQDFVFDLEGIRRVWFEAKLGDLVASRDATLAKSITDQLLDTEVKINKLGDVWDQVLASPENSAARNDAEAVVKALQDLADGLKTAGNKLGVLVLIPNG